MNKGEFLYNLRNNLKGVPKEEVEAIIQDYSMHINELLEEGEELEDILIKLGNPKDIAAQYLEELGYNQSAQDEPKEEIHREETVNNNTNYDANRTYQSSTKNVPVFILMQFINFFVIGWAIFGVGVAIFSVGVSGVAVAASSLGVLFLNRSANVGIRILQMFVMLGVGVLLFNGALAVAIVLGKLLIKYVKWNISLIS